MVLREFPVDSYIEVINTSRKQEFYIAPGEIPDLILCKEKRSGRPSDLHIFLFSRRNMRGQTWDLPIFPVRFTSLLIWSNVVDIFRKSVDLQVQLPFFLFGARFPGIAISCHCFEKRETGPLATKAIWYCNSFTSARSNTIVNCQY